MTTTISLSKAEKSYIQAGLLSNPPSRADGRSLHDFRSISLETGVAPLANGSARLSIGRNPFDGSGGTEILAATKLEVETIAHGSTGVEGGRITCSVTCSPAAYPNLSSLALEDLQSDMTSILHDTLSHRTLHPGNLGILPGKRAWLLNLDLVVMVDSGNAYDAMFMAARAALWDTKVPRTRSVEYKAMKSAMGGREKIGDGDANMDVDGFDTRQIQHATDFELRDYWDEGEVLYGRQHWPVCVTLNLVPPVHVLDATLFEEAAIPLRLLLIFQFDSSQAILQGIRTLGSGEMTAAQIAELSQHGEKYARDIWQSLNNQLKDGDADKLKEKTKFQ